MGFCPLKQAVSFLAFGEGGAESSDLFREAAERFVYLINREFGTGISVAMRGRRAEETDLRKIDLIFLKSIDAAENRALVREYRIVPVNDVFSDEELRERVCETPFFDVEVDLDALKKLSECLEGRVCFGEKRIISVRENPEYAEKAASFFQNRWGNERTAKMYEDCIMHSVNAENPFPQWYLLCDGENAVGGAGLVLNDFISRADLYPWLCALYVDEAYRGNGYGKALIERVKKGAKAAGMRFLYLCTELEGFYERAGFEYMADGYHSSGEKLRIYGTET